MNETKNETDNDTTPATITNNETGTADTIVANGTNETTADRHANENVSDENNEMDEQMRGRLITLGRLPKASNQKSDVWKHIKQLGYMEPTRIDNDNNQPSTHYCEHFGHLFSLPVNSSIKKGRISYMSTKALNILQKSYNVYAGSKYKEERFQLKRVKNVLKLKERMKFMESYESKYAVNDEKKTDMSKSLGDGKVAKLLGVQ